MSDELRNELERHLRSALRYTNDNGKSLGTALNIFDRAILAASRLAVLDKHARVGNTIFRAGVRASLVIGRAQREYEYRASDPATIPPDVDPDQFDYVSPRAGGELANTTGIPAELCLQIGAAFWRRAMPGVPPPDDDTMVHAVSVSLMLLGDRLAAQVAQGVPDDVVRDAAVGAAIGRAARELPFGYDIRIEIERDAGTVSLYGPDCNEIRLDFDGDTFAGEINTAVNTALTIHQHDLDADAMLEPPREENGYE